MLGTLSHSLRHENAKLDALTHTHVCTRQSKAECEKKTWASDTYVRYVMLRADEIKETGESDSGKLIFDVNVKFMWKCNAPIINIFDR